MYSGKDTLAGGFPHSDTSGSKLICQLPEAFRRLSRLSSPIIAKASTTCSYSLDPITLSPKTQSLSRNFFSRYAVVTQITFQQLNMFVDAIKFVVHHVNVMTTLISTL